MEKLIDLLNEYGEYDLVEHNGEICKWDTNDEGEINIYTDYTNNIISKKFGFIKRLVQNDKINFDKVMKLGIPCFVQYDKGEIISVHDVDFDRQLIMLLSISDSPVDDLISYLK